MAAADVAERAEQLVAVDSHPIGHGQQQVFDREVLVAHVGPLAVGRGEHVAKGPVDGGLLPADGLWQSGELRVDPVAHHRRLHAHPGEDGTGDPIGLVEDGGEHMVRA